MKYGIRIRFFENSQNIQVNDSVVTQPVFDIVLAYVGYIRRSSIMACCFGALFHHAGLLSPTHHPTRTLNKTQLALFLRYNLTMSYSDFIPLKKNV